MKYLKKFNTHTEYEEARQNLILPNVSLCEQENEVHYHEFEYTIMFDVYTNSDVDIIDSDTQEVLYTIDSTHYGPFNMKKNKTYIARLVNGQTTQTQRPCDWSFSSDDIVYGEVAIDDYKLYEYNIGYETLRFVKRYDMIDYPSAYIDFELIDCYDPDIMLRDAISNNGINVINQKFRDYAIDNNKTNYIEFYYDNNVLKARIKNAQTNDIVDVGRGDTENTMFPLDNYNILILGKDLQLSDYTMRTGENSYEKLIQIDVWSQI